MSLSDAIRWAEHNLNSLHVYTRLVKLGVKKESALSFSQKYAPL